MGISASIVNNLLIIASAANVVIGLLVLSRNRLLRLNQYFFVLSVSIAGWSATNVLFQTVPLGLKYALALVSYAFAIFLGVSFFLLGREISGRKRTRLDSSLLVAGVIVAITSTIPGVLATGVTAPGSVVARTPLLAVYGLTLLLLIGRGLVSLVRALQNNSDAERARVKLILAGFGAGASVGVFCNLVLPLFGVYALVAVGPSGSLIFVALTAYAIVKHRLFDIRLVIARSLGYVFALSAMAVIYGFIVFGFARLVLQLHFSLTAQIFLSVATSIVALSFSRIKRVFDRLSNRLFYQDAYDVQDLYDRLNRILVSTLDTNKLLRETSKLLQSSFRSEFVVIGLKESELRDVLIIGALPGQSFDEAVPIARRLTIKHHQRVIVTDYLESSELKLKRLLEQYNIAILVRLTPNITKEEEGLGYIAFGHKKSGSSYSSGDVRVLDTIANELIVAVQNALHFEEIQNFNKTLQERVNKATSELRHANDRLKALDRTKDDFISMASHQLRTPLTSIKGYLSMVLEGDAGKLNANQYKLLEQSFFSAQRMVYLIGDLLNLSRLSTGKFVIEAKPLDLSNVVQAEIDQLRETAKARELKLVYNKPTALPMMMLDETKIHQVVMNLVDNAIYYTPAGGSVTVDLHETPTAIECLVKDTGIGVPKVVQHRLFTKFYRAQNAQRARPDGTGLGLFMVRKTIAAHGGSIIFQSQEGKGSTFGFRFSKAAHLAPAMQPHAAPAAKAAVPGAPALTH